MERMDECFDQSNKERPLSLPLFFALGSIRICVCVWVCYLSTPPVTMQWDENEGRQPGEQCRKQRDRSGGLHSISVELNPAHLLPNNGEVTMNQRHTEIWEMEVGETHTWRQYRCTQSLPHLFSPSFYPPRLLPSFHLYRPVLALNRSTNRLSIVQRPRD